MDTTLVASALRASLAPDANERRRATEALQAASSQPGSYCAALLQLTHPGCVSDEGERLLAATQLKNTVMRHWRKGGEIGEEERSSLRAALFARLAVDEGSERVDTQLALAAARVMRCEVNQSEATVLEALAGALSRPTVPNHAILMLSYAAKELGSMRLPAQRRAPRAPSPRSG